MGQQQEKKIWECCQKSSWQVKLSAVIMGAGQNDPLFCNERMA